MSVFLTQPPLKKSGRRGSDLAGASPAPTLDKIKAGQTVKVVETVAGRAATLQLAQLGIRSGATLVVRRSAPLGGAMMVESGGSTVAIGRGMARKVLVRILE
jgi:Fe2+ transport system protein FeoA